MTKIVISGYYGFGNAGDEAMLDAILEAMYDVLPDVEFVVISGNPDSTMQKHGVKAIPRFAAKQIFSELKSCDLLISGGGSLLQDVTSDRSLYYYLSIIRMATFLKKPVMLYAQGIGPIRRKMAKMAVSSVLNDVDLITVRDEGSREELHSLGITKPRIETTADPVLGLHRVDTGLGRLLLSEYSLKGSKQHIGVSVREWKNDISYRIELASALDELRENCDGEIIFIPMQYPHDVQEAKEIQKLMKTEAIVLEKAYTTPELLALSGCMDVLVGVRLHALIFAALMEKPFIGISYDPKIQRFLTMMESQAVGTLKSLDQKKLVSSVKEALQQKGLKESSLQQLAKLKAVSLKNAHLAITLLDKNN